MSLHVELSSETREALKKQRRNSTISSIVIACLVMVLVMLILGIIALKVVLREVPPFAIYQTTSVDEPSITKINVSTSREQKPSTPPSSMARMIASTAVSNISIPVPDVDVTSPSVEYSDGNSFGNGWNNGNGNGQKFTGLPPIFNKRCSKGDRLNRLQETGGTPECEDAVVKGLNWLKATQSADGSWPGGNPAAMTGFAVLCYLGHCETPLSKDYGESCLRAITYLVNLGLKTDGKLTTNTTDNHWPYEHAIATYALAEASTFCKQDKNINIPNLYDVTTKAGFIILNNQHKSGGWDYSYDTYGPRGGDTSVSAWQMQALKAIKHSNLVKPSECEKVARHGLDYFMRMQNSNGGFGYSNPNAAHTDYFTMSGAGLLCLQQWGKGGQSGARRASKYIEDNTKFEYKTEFADLYGHYYEAQAMMNRGGNQWKKYNDMFRDELLKNQSPDGSWPTPGAGKLRAVTPQYQTNITYRTCLCILMLEVYYRFLPGTGSK